MRMPLFLSDLPADRGDAGREFPPVPLFRPPEDHWPTEDLEQYVGLLQTTIDAGALPGLIVPLLTRARNILRERAQPDSESGGCPVVPAL